MDAKKNIYAEAWDSYVEGWNPTHDSHRWPGDEWGGPSLWESWYEKLFVSAGSREWKRTVEIGPGSGKYTLLLLNDSKTEIRAFDVSERYLQICENRCETWIRDGRLSLHILEGKRADEMLLNLQESGWVRKVDAFYSIDSMVHVDLQYLVAYFLTAALSLRPGGQLIFTLADATRDGGFDFLMECIGWFYTVQGQPSGKFEWLSPEIVSYTLNRLGFRVDSFGSEYRDMLLIATLVDPSKAELMRKYLGPVGRETTDTEAGK